MLERQRKIALPYSKLAHDPRLLPIDMGDGLWQLQIGKFLIVFDPFENHWRTTFNFPFAVCGVSEH